ncbi:helix-turn-helix domain-containing protein [Streptomyces sp. NPDC004111]|uniref:helix-turn-helix domain-containing protein n=1 Tax=Streptomyces sp. NPDC004111 TaxID=3364690 RepID=UPI0036771020
MQVVLDTSRFPPRDRTAAWEETSALALVTTRFRFPEPDKFGALIRAMDIGPAQLSQISYGGLVSYRSSRLIRQSDPEIYQIAVIQSGRQSIEQGGHASTMCAGEAVFYDSSRPFTGVVEGNRKSGCLLLQFPRKLMPLPDKVVSPMCGSPLSGAGGVGMLLRGLLQGLIASAADYTAADLDRLGTTVIDLAAAAVARHTEQTSLLMQETRSATLYREIGAYISSRLEDPRLSLGTVAAAHNISVRTLQRLFSQHEESVGELIRNKRLARCRRDLSDQALAGVSIAAIGARWGFSRPSSFSRAFRDVYGTTPNEYRSGARESGCGG